MKTNKALFKRSFKEYGRDIAKFGILQLFLIILFTLSTGYILGTNAVDNSYYQTTVSETIENGNFSTLLPLVDEQISKIEQKENVTIAAQFYEDFLLNENGHSIRVYSNRDELNKPTIKSGRLPQAHGEIAIIDLYSVANNIALNSILTFGTNPDANNLSATEPISFTVVGIVSFPDYISVYQSNTDVTYKQRTFCISMVTAPDFIALTDTQLKTEFNYAYRYNEVPTADNQRVLDAKLNDTINDVIYEDLININYLRSFVPKYQNRCIVSGEGFAKQYDGFVMLFIYILVVVIAFAFGISTTSRVNEESKTIGTLRASGYTRGKLVGLYTILPIVIVVLSAIIGDLLGYFVFSKFFANIFLQMLSLGTLTVQMTFGNFLVTTLVPSLIMLLINIIILIVAFKVPVKRLLTGELIKPKAKKAIALKEETSFTTRFRKRIFLQNISNFVVLAIGIMLGSILFSFGISYKVSCSGQMGLIESNSISNYQYVLRMPINTTTEGAEELMVYSVSYQKNNMYLKSNISVFGVIDDSKYVNINFRNEDGSVKEGFYVSSAFADKYNVKVGESVRVVDGANQVTRDVSVIGVYKYDVAPCLFCHISRIEEYMLSLMDISKEDAVATLDLLGVTLPHGYIFNSYYTNELIEDVPTEYITGFVSKDNLFQDARQIDMSSSSIAVLVIVVGIAFDVLLMFLLVKQIIDKNRNNIAMCKILGFSDPEVTKLYISTTSLVAVAALLISLPLTYLLVKLMFKFILYPSMMSFVTFLFPWWIFFACFACGLVAFLISVVLEYRHIKKISMVEVLKS